MTWTDIYLICFLVGFALTVLSALSGFFHLHLPGMAHGHGVDLHLPHHGHAHGMHLGVFNFATVTAFLTWFGGIGFLLSRYSGLLFWFAFASAAAGGVIGAGIVFLFLTRVLLAHERPLNAMDYEMVGVFGQLTSAIREGGTGEIGFSQEGVRRGAPARSDDGSAIAKFADVVVTRYENGVAYVRRWEDLADSKETN